ncbi:MAG: 4-hydroxythreonine-4-phosphate dehydrogenase PdxA [Planctomycetota bacterium]
MDLDLGANPAERPLLGLTVGDPAGIGPETVRAALEEPTLTQAARILVLGPAACRPDHVPLLPADDRLSLSTVRDAAWLDTGGPQEWQMGEVQVACGRAALDALRRGVELAREDRIDALVTAPVNKEAINLAGEPCEGQTELIGRWCDAPRVQMLAVAERLRVLLLTRHLPLADALGLVSTERVLDHLVLLDETLRRLGLDSPRLALAGLNPHAGENGLLGAEDGDVLVPAVEQARARGIVVEGPISPDTVFLAASQGRHDGVLALYHDQGLIPVKLLSPHRGLTLLAGLPFLRVSPAHGTAFDIAGRGLADAGNLLAALFQAAEWARARLERRRRG